MGQPTTLITGASRGIGRGIGLSLASIGHDLVINYAGNEQAALQTAEQCQEVAKQAGHGPGRCRLCSGSRTTPGEHA